MADKYVQLKDSNGNNLYPLSTSPYQNMGQVGTDIRIGTFEGKPLWRRVEKFTNVPKGYSSYRWTAGTIPNFDMVVFADGMWKAGGATSYVPINSLPPDAVGNYGICIRDFSATGWVCVLGTGMNTTNSGYVIVDYTTTS